MLLVPAKGQEAEWAWDFHNSDGSPAEMCGNGARCFARFIQKVAGCGTSTSFETIAGIIRAEFDGDLVTVNLTPPADAKFGDELNTPQGALTVHSMNTGVPHAVIYVDDADKAMVRESGAAVRNHEHFAPKGTNVNFVEVKEPGFIRVRTYERGVENETLACGTGVAASALVSAKTRDFNSPIRIQVQGGDTLEVAFDRDGDQFMNVRLKGPADFVFTGTCQV